MNALLLLAAGHLLAAPTFDDLTESNTEEWSEFKLKLPQEALDVGTIIIEFEFLSSDTAAGAGWFIDDDEVR